MFVNSLIGKSEALDHVARVLASDYLMPLAFSAVIFAIWFLGRDKSERRRYQKSTLIAAVAIGISNFIVDVINAVYDRPRPFEDLGDSISMLFYRSTDPSFPANPMAVVFAVAMAVTLANRRLGYALFTVATVYSFLRIYVGTFYPTDVIGGAIVGIVAALLAWLLFEIVRPIPEIVLRIMRGLGVA